MDTLSSYELSSLLAAANAWRSLPDARMDVKAAPIRKALAELTTLRSQISGMTAETSGRETLEPLTEAAVLRVRSLLDVYAPDVFDLEMAANVVSTSLQAVQQFPSPPESPAIPSKRITQQ